VVALLRWVVVAILPALLFLVLVRRTHSRNRPRSLMVATFALGGGAAFVARFITIRAAEVTGLDERVAAVGERGALVFLFLVVATTQEAGKAGAAWPAFLSKRFDDAFDGIVYSAAAALGFASVEAAVVLRANPHGVLWIARVLLALPAHVFFACLWGYALGRAKRSTERIPIFPAAFLGAVLGHGLYSHFVYGRGPGALFALPPMLAVMGAVAWLVARDMRSREGRSGRFSAGARRPFERPGPAMPVRMSAVRAALTTGLDEPVKIGWVLFGALVTIGAMIVGVGAGVLAARAMHIDLSLVDEHDAAAASPVLLLGIGLLSSFPASGWLIARAAGVHSLLEPALAAMLALVVAVVSLGVAAPFTVVFALALSPVAWLLACVGAWIGREA
jgi:RsiW-degrading membrane proteinase PrsW (M82 family)